MSIKNFEPIPAGIYHLRVTKCEERGNAGSEFLSWSLDVASGPSQGEQAQYATPMTMGPNSKAFKFLLALGMIPADKGDVDTNSFIGREFYGDMEVVMSKANKLKNEFKSIWSIQEYLTKFGAAPPGTSPAVQAAPVVVSAPGAIPPAPAAPAAPVAPAAPPVAPVAPVIPVAPPAAPPVAPPPVAPPVAPPAAPPVAPPPVAPPVAPPPVAPPPVAPPPAAPPVDAATAARNNLDFPQ